MGPRRIVITPELLRNIAGFALLGLNNQKIANHLGMELEAFEKWACTHKEVSKALKNNREVADIDVANALRKRALGYDYTEIVIDRTSGMEDDILEVTPEGAMELAKEETAKIKIVKKHMPPDVTAIIFTLKNRHPEEWRDKKVVDANITGNITFNFGDDSANEPIGDQND